MSEFKPGDMVECVYAKRHNGRPWTRDPLENGKFYTVEAVLWGCLFQSGKTECGLRLVGMTNNGPNNCYEASRFRLIKPRATDISIFREIVKEAMETGKVTA